VDEEPNYVITFVPLPDGFLVTEVKKNILGLLAAQPISLPLPLPTANSNEKETK